MRKNVTLILVLLSLAASCIIAPPPVSGAGVAENSWATRAPMHVARAGLGVAVIGGKIYAIGGSNSQDVVNSNEEYDPATDHWTFRTAMPTARNFFAIAVNQGKIYCIGGATGNGTVSAVNEVYDPYTGTWETKAPMPTARCELQAAVVDGKIYLMGGADGTSITGVNEVYNPTTDTWSTKSSIPIATTIYASTVSNNSIYVIGGFYGGDPDVNPNQIYNPATDTWSLGASPPYGGVGVAAATTGINAPERIYFFRGGINQIYDPKNNSWTVGADFSIKDLVKFSVTAVDDMIYVIGGVTVTFPGTIDYTVPLGSNGVVTYYSTVEQYTPWGYGTIPPVVTIVSPHSGNYSSSSIPLNFTVNRVVDWVGFSLDGKEALTVTGNTTLLGLSNGLHAVTIYANDTFGNTGTSETTSFIVAVPESFPVVPVAAASAVVVVVGSTGLLLYRRKRRREAGRT